MKHIKKEVYQFWKFSILRQILRILITLIWKLKTCRNDWTAFFLLINKDVKIRVVLQGVLVVTYAVVQLFLFVTEHVLQWGWSLSSSSTFWSDSVPDSGSDVFCLCLISIRLALSFSDWLQPMHTSVVYLLMKATNEKKHIMGRRNCWPKEYLSDKESTF